MSHGDGVAPAELLAGTLDGEHPLARRALDAEELARCLLDANHWPPLVGLSALAPGLRIDHKFLTGGTAGLRGGWFTREAGRSR
jgi:hypothetical protein